LRMWRWSNQVSSKQYTLATLVGLVPNILKNSCNHTAFDQQCSAASHRVLRSSSLWVPKFPTHSLHYFSGSQFSEQTNSPVQLKTKFYVAIHTRQTHLHPLLVKCSLRSETRTTHVERLPVCYTVSTIKRSVGNFHEIRHIRILFKKKSCKQEASCVNISHDTIFWRVQMNFYQ
jgi:hypothetical protein